MSDPRELGLPPASGAPAFSSSPDVLSAVRRRHSRRRQRRMVAVGGGLAAVIVAVAVAINPAGKNDGLEQLPPSKGGTQASNSASPQPQPLPSSAARPVAGPVTSPLPRTTSTTSGRGAAAAPTPGPAKTVPTDSTPVRRDRTTLGDELCGIPVRGWGATGWCFLADSATQLTAGQTVTLSVSLCRNGSSPGQVRFPNRQQAAWSVAQPHHLFWASSEQPSAFSAGETVTLQPKECLRWRVDWHVTTHGRPMPDGNYSLQWNTGADLRDPEGRGYHDSTNVHVGPASSNGIGPFTAGLARLAS